MVRGRLVGRAISLPGYALFLFGLAAVSVGVAYPTWELLGALTPSAVVSSGAAVDGRSLVVGGGFVVAGSSALVLGGLLVAVHRRVSADS